MESKARMLVELANASASVSIEQVGGSSRRGLVVLTEDLKRYETGDIPFSNNAFGVDMNQSGLFSGTPLHIHDGTDTTLNEWTATNVVGGKMTDDSTDRSNSGTKSVKVDNPSVGDVWQLDKGSSQSLAGHAAITFAVNVDKDWTGDSIEIYAWDGASEVGTRVALEAYFSQSSFDVWHSVVIPLEDMGLTSSTITGLRMQLISRSGAKAPKFYLDDIQLEETGSPVVFQASAPVGEKVLVDSIRVILADALAGTVASGTMMGLSYDKLLALTQLPTGILVQHMIRGVVVQSFAMRDIGDFWLQGFQVVSTSSDGTNTAIVMEKVFKEPLVLGGNADQNSITLTVQDDLTGLLRFQAVLIARLQLPE